jgi:hypothetical protein
MKQLTYVLAFLAMAGFFSPLTSGAPKESRLKKIMEGKLRNSQRLLEGIVTRNFAKITSSAEKLIQLSKTAEWQVLQTPRFELHSDEFRSAAEAVVRKAKDKNLDGAALSYLEMTLSCVRCHNYVREVREARLPAPRPDLATVFAGNRESPDGRGSEE